jgi:hypothetical protein
VTPESWLFRNSFLPSRDALARLRSTEAKIGLCVLTRNAAFTLGRHLLLLQHGWPGGIAPWSEILVADLGSTDSTGDIAREHGAIFLEPAERLAATLEPPSDGDGLARALAATKSDILFVVPSSLIRLDVASIATMIRSLLDDPAIQLCLGASDAEGGPMSTLGTRPLLAALHPELALVVDPTTPLLALRTAGIRDLPLARSAGYECALVVDCRANHGLESLAQVRVPPLEWEVLDPRLDPARAFKTVVALLESLRRTGHLSTTRELGHLYPRPKDWTASGPRFITSLEVFPWTKKQPQPPVADGV